MPNKFPASRSARALALMLLFALAACAPEEEPRSFPVESSAVQLGATAYSVGAADEVEISVLRTGGAEGAVAVDYSTLDGTAVSDRDFIATEGTLRWTDGDDSPKSFRVITNPGSEGRSFAVALQNAQNASMGTQASASVSINGVAFPSPGIVQLVSDSLSVNQASGSITVVVRRSGGASGAVAVNYTTANGTAIAGTHYTASIGTLAWPDGDSGERTVVIPIAANPAFSGQRTFSISLSGAIGASLGARTTASIAVNGSAVTTPAPGSVALTSGSFTVSQSAGSITLTVSRSGGSAGEGSVQYATANGTATSGSDYTSTAGTLRWNNGESSSKTITIPISNAQPFVGTRTFTVSLASATNVGLGSTSSATVSIAGSGGAGQVALANATYSVGQAAGTLSVAVRRSGGSVGAASVRYTTVNGTATAGTDFTSASGTLNWGTGDAADKIINIPISNATPFNGSKTFSITLTNAQTAAMGTPSSATVTITGSDAAGTVALSASSYSIDQAGGSAVVTVRRTGGSAGAASVQYATADDSAVAGTHYTQVLGTLSWNDGDASSKTISIPVSNSTPFSGTRSFKITLRNAVGSQLGAQSSGTVSITGSVATGTCEKTSASRELHGVYDSILSGQYWINTNNWNGAPNLSVWFNDHNCWGASTTATTGAGNTVLAYPSITRGWLHNYPLVQQSTPGTYDWTTRSGMGVRVDQLSKAQVRWDFEAPTAAGDRWLGLIDIYFHDQSTPNENDFFADIDILLFQAIRDLDMGGGRTYFADIVAAGGSSHVVTLGGNKYLFFIDETVFHDTSSGGHTIQMFLLPTAYTDRSTGVAWGSTSAKHDIKAIVDYFRQSNPRDDDGNPVRYYNGTAVTSPVISNTRHLTAINAGWEIGRGSPYKTTRFCVAMQNEPDCT